MFKSENTASDEIVVFLTENGSAAGARYPAFVFLSFPFSLRSFDCASRLLSTVGSHVCAKTRYGTFTKETLVCKKKRVRQGKVNLEIPPRARANFSEISRKNGYRVQKNVPTGSM